MVVRTLNVDFSKPNMFIFHFRGGVTLCTSSSDPPDTAMYIPIVFELEPQITYQLRGFVLSPQCKDFDKPEIKPYKKMSAMHNGKATTVNAYLYEEING